MARLEAKGPASVGEIAAPFEIKLPAVMKHIDVLLQAGLVSREKTGRTVCVRLEASPMREAQAWLARYERFWSRRLDKLARVAEARAVANANLKGK